MSKRTGLVGGIVLAVLFVFAFVAAIICLERIPVGYEGVVYSMSEGVNGEVLEQGWHIVSPTKKVKEFNISNSQLVLTQDERDGSKEDESFRVTSSDNATIAVSFQMSYRFIPETLVETFKTYKGMDGDDIIDSRVRTVLKSRISEVTTDYSLMDLYSGNRSEINDRITKYLDDKFSRQFGIEVIDASIIDVHPDKQLKEAINKRITAQQEADQAKAEQEKAKVEAETALIKAENDAKVKLTKAEATAKANKAISDSLTKELIEQNKIEKWDGVLPKVSGADTLVKVD